MSNVTPIQKKVFLDFAAKYDPDVYAIVNRGAPDFISVNSEVEVEELELFASKICALVLVDHPEYDGRDEDINQDAAMVSFLISNLIHGFRMGNGSMKA
jgi:hypothetical protein